MRSSHRHTLRVSEEDLAEQCRKCQIYERVTAKLFNE